MSERIDLTQFEDCDEGPWEYSEPSECIFGPLNEELDYYPILVNFPPTLYGVTTGEEYNNHPEVLKHRKVTKDGKVYHAESFWWGDRIPAMKANLKLMAAAPDLLAELKRCYKLLDDADNARSRYGDEEEHQDIDNVCDAYEAVCIALDGRGRW